MQQTVELLLERRTLGETGEKLRTRALLLGLLALAFAVGGALAVPAWKARFFASYLVAFAWVLSFSLGGLFFVMLQHLVHAGWSVVVRRLAEFFASLLPLCALLALPLLLGLGQLYHWSHPEAVAADPLLQAKAPYLNVPFFVLRFFVYLGFWWWAARFFTRSSFSQDQSGDVNVTRLLQRRAAPFMIGFALTLTFAAFDWLMSLDPHWYSTIFGVYYFAGAVVGFFALLVVLAVSLQRAGFLRRTITVEHYHDLGKLLFAFVVFWAYIAFSQFMLIWYGNIPEETAWIMRRMSGGFGIVGLVLLFGHFLLPFLLLLPRKIKRSPGVLFYPAVWLVLVHYLDLYWLVMPEVGSATPHPLDLLLAVGLGGVWLAGFAHLAVRFPLACQKDPRLFESLTFENA
jgi:hypothetical protein